MASKSTTLAPADGAAPIAKRAEQKNLPVAKRGDPKPFVSIIPHDEWVSARLIDTADGETQTRREKTDFVFEVTRPRLYAGQKLYLTAHDGIARMFDPANPGSVASFFPGCNFLDAEEAWKYLSAIPLRVHVGHTEYVDVESGERRYGYRVVSFRPDERARV